ncbi:MAG: DUF1559 domain-containing protein [Pirellulaceae bacterium]|nr:DUF1559 domain-containing protein [Pirellulaceae bacterium]
MPFPVSCQCGQKFMAQDHLVGKTVPCPSCGRGLQIRRPGTSNRAQAAATSAILVHCQCGRSYKVAANLAGQSMRCKACGFVLHVPRPGATQPAWDPLDDPLGAAAAMQPAPRPQHVLPARPRTREHDNSALVRNLAIAGGAVAGLIGLWVVGYLVFSALTRQVADAAADPAETSDAPAAMAPSDAGRQPLTVLPPSGTADVLPGATPDEDTLASNPDSSGHPEDVTEASAAQSRSDLPPLASGLVRWFDEPDTPRAGVRRVGTAGMPTSHYSWMCGLLPYLGHQDLYDKFNFSRPWMQEPNLQLAGEIVPEFLNPADTRDRYEGYPFKGMALTHFVGVSGVEDRRTVVAASLPRSDPRAGVFGYDAVARPSDITDGTSNTAMILGSGELASPWMLGGGGTVRGARQPYFDSLSGFGSRGRQSSGTLAVMADGSVRFISAEIDPVAFRALCTIRGGETIDLTPWVETAELGR